MLRVYLLALLVASMGIVQPYLYRWIVDEIVMSARMGDRERIQMLLFAGGVIVVLLIVSYILNYIRIYRTAVLTHRIAAGLGGRLLRHMLNLPLHELSKMKVGGAVSRLNNDTTTASQIVNRGLLIPGMALFNVGMSLIIAFVLDWRISGAALLLVGCIVLAAWMVSRRSKSRFVALQKQQERLFARGVEIFGGVRLLRLFGRERGEALAYARVRHEFVRKSLRARRVQIFMESGWWLVGGAIQASIVVVGGYMVITDAATVGEVFAIMLYSGRIIGPCNQLVQSYDQVQESVAAVDRLNEVMTMSCDKPDRPGAVAAPEAIRCISFRHVSFRYSNETKHAISDVCFDVAGGEVVAVVGKSGAGKSTLIDLLVRFHDPHEGCIAMNGIDIRSMRIACYRKLFGLVQQDVFLFEDSIKSNISYASPNACFDDIVAAAKNADAHDFICALPDGYDTLVGERGERLSGGQRQRIGIARAYLANPKILILDEATSNLDGESEKKIQEVLAGLMRDRTVFVVTHRLASIRKADRILVIEDGSVRETGTHQELINQKDAYYRMIETQQGIGVS